MSRRACLVAVAALDLLFGLVTVPQGLILLDWLASSGHPGLSLATGQVPLWALLIAGGLLAASVVSAAGALAARGWAWASSLVLGVLAMPVWALGTVAGVVAPEHFAAPVAVAFGLAHVTGVVCFLRPAVRGAFRPSPGR
jgi:hypothetical protein